MITASKDKTTKFWHLPDSFEWENDEPSKGKAVLRSEPVEPRPNPQKANNFQEEDSDSGSEESGFKPSKPKAQTVSEEPKPASASSPSKETEKKKDLSLGPMPVGFVQRGDDSQEEEELDGWDH